MSIHVLASGSKGNATLFQIGGKNILVDCGISCQRLEQELANLNLSPSNLDAIVVTHEHSDHISGLPRLLRRHQCQLYARQAVRAAVQAVDNLPAGCLHDLGDSLSIGSVKIEPFSISHDAVDPVGFAIYYRDKKYALMTDNGFAGPSARHALADCTALVVEANHDIDMLRKGRYPWLLKRRIMSNRGHMANTDCGWLLARLARRQSMTVMLAHLSEENNKPQLALDTVDDILTKQGIDTDKELSLIITEQRQRISWWADGEEDNNG